MRGASRDGWLTHIDGLRAVAVLSVLFYHVNPAWVPGGFVGVDVFFVISGYLISGIIFREVFATGRFDFGRFYERRARRILPAFVTVTGGTLVAGYLMLWPQDFAELAKSVAYSTLFSANIYFYLLSDYFAPAAETMPLLHYWSLGVEEQFYIFFPLVVIGLAWHPRFALAAVVAIAAVSLVAAEWFVQTEPQAAFYLTPLRAWELLAGAIVALPGFPRIAKRTVREGASLAGLTLIVVSFALYSDATPFPGVMAGVPVLGAAVILWAGASGSTATGWLLSLPPIRWVGLWSYSIYMVHWPIIVLTRLAWPEWGAVGNVWLVTAAISLGALSYFLVETPFRRPSDTKHRARVLGAAAFSIASIVIAAAAGVYIPRAGGPAEKILAFRNIPTQDLYRTGTCFLERRQKWDDLSPDCLAVRGRTILLWGDSHAAHLYRALQDALNPSGTTLLQASASACLPTVAQRRPLNCPSFNEGALRWIGQNKVEKVVMSAIWPGDTDSIGKLRETIEILARQGIPVVVLGPSPIFGAAVPLIVADLINGRKPHKELSKRFFAMSFKRDEAMRAALSGMTGVTYVSLMRQLCPTGSCPLLTPEGVPLMWDSNHFTYEGATLAVSGLGPLLASMPID